MKATHLDHTLATSLVVTGSLLTSAFAATTPATHERAPKPADAPG